MLKQLKIENGRMVKSKKTIVSSLVVIVSFLTYLGWALKKKMNKKRKKEQFGP
jgi:hypothetical protein